MKNELVLDSNLWKVVRLNYQERNLRDKNCSDIDYYLCLQMMCWCLNYCDHN